MVVEEQATGRVVLEIPPPADVSANAEALDIANETLQKKHAASREKHLHRGGIFLYWCAIVAVAVTGSVWLWHMIGPDKWLFLPEHRRMDLQNVLISALGSAFVTEISRRWISRDE